MIDVKKSGFGDRPRGLRRFLGTRVQRDRPSRGAVPLMDFFNA
jgi:hypothetical protein